MRCRLCGGKAVPFLDLGRQPLANKYPKAEEFAAEKTFPLQLHFCPTCKAMQTGKIIPPEQLFTDYFYLSSVNKGLVAHFEALADKLRNAKFVVDIGSNDGVLLRPLKERGVRALGIEPSVNVAKIANDAGLETKCMFFGAFSAAAILVRHGQPDVIVAASVFTHTDAPLEFLKDAATLLAPGGRLIIEVEYLGAILRSFAFERFYFDRPHYFSVTAVDRLCRAAGLRVLDVERIDPHGGMIRLTIVHGPAGTPPEKVRVMLFEEESTIDAATIDDFEDGVNRGIDPLLGMLYGFQKTGTKVVGYGAPARLSTICNYADIGPDLIAFTVDDSPLKQGRFTPGTHIPIVNRWHLVEHRPEVIVVFAHEYLADIRSKVGEGFRWFTPIPPREVI